MISKVKNDLFDYQNRYIMQIENGFKFSLDSILLAEFVNVRNKDKLILDMCTGNAPVPLILSLKTNAKIIGFEVLEIISNLADESISLNGLNEQIKIINDNIKNIGKYYEKGIFDIITCNPPFFKVNKGSLKNISYYKRVARHEELIKLDDIFKIVALYLKDNGSFYLVHRPERLDDIIYLARINDLNVKDIQFIKTKENGEVKILLVKCVKHSKTGVKLEKNICVDNLSTYQHLFERSD